MPPKPVSLGEFFDLAEFERTGTGLPNAAPSWAIVNMRALVGHVLDPLRRRLGKQIRITSGYRSAAVNQAVRGSKSSDHCFGRAADFKVEGMTARELLGELLDSGVNWHQAIAYHPSQGGHVHVAFRRDDNARELAWKNEHGDLQVLDPADRPWANV
jgi:Uncharacterized protein conserved in bacteria